jgi:hypothetical protein
VGACLLVKTTFNNTIFSLMSAIDKKVAENDDHSESSKEVSPCMPCNSKTIDLKDPIGSMTFVDRYLSIWIISVMIIGVVVGYYSPETQEGLHSIDGSNFLLIFRLIIQDLNLSILEDLLSGNFCLYHALFLFYHYY